MRKKVSTTMEVFIENGQKRDWGKKGVMKETVVLRDEWLNGWTVEEDTKRHK